MRITRLKTIIFSLSIVTIMLIFPLPFTLAQAPGDANGDGQINILDITVMLNDILQIAPAPGNGDCNNDGAVNILDVTCGLNIILEITPPPMEPRCGDNMMQVFQLEDCDGSDLGGKDCVSLGFDGGTLSCNVLCLFDTSGCFTVTTPENVNDCIPIATGFFETNYVLVQDTFQISINFGGQSFVSMVEVILDDIDDILDGVPNVTVSGQGPFEHQGFITFDSFAGCGISAESPSTFITGGNFISELDLDFIPGTSFGPTTVTGEQIINFSIIPLRQNATIYDCDGFKTDVPGP